MRWEKRIGYLGNSTLRTAVESVTNPGRITVSNGSTDIATLSAREIVCRSMTVIDSRCIRSAFGAMADEELALHREARRYAAKPLAAIDPEFFGIIKKQVFMRILGRIRSNRHGGALIFIPDERKDVFLSENPYVRIRYRFAAEEPCRRFRTLIVKIADALAEFHGSFENPAREVGWTEYLTGKKQTLSSLDESVFEWAHLVACMTQVDDAVVMTERLELVGFGAQISGKLEYVDTVAQALDPEGCEIRKEQTDCVGSRHNSAYSLCSALHDVLAVVVSQDGTAQLIKWNDGMVTVWELIVTEPHRGITAALAVVREAAERNWGS